MENFLNEIGEFGPYQQRNFLLLSLPTIVVAMQKFAWVFLGARVKHRCKLPWEERNATYLLQEKELHLYYPFDTDNGYSQCQVYSKVYSQPFNGSGEDDGVSSCTEFIYDTSEYKSSAVIDYNLVCDRTWLRATVQSVFMVGMLFGSYIFGDLSDRIGRKPMFLSAISMMLIVGVGQAAILNYYVFTATRFVLGASLQGIFLVAYVIMMEMVGKGKRVVVGMLAHVFYSFAYFISAGIAYGISSWRWLQVAYTLPALLFAPYYWIIPESARWLSTKGRSKEAKKILEKAAEANDKKVSEDLLLQVVKQPSGENEGNFIDLFRYRSLRLKTLLFFFIWMVNAGVYYGLTLNTSNLGGNDYLNFVISGAVEIPAIIFSLLILDRIGRKLPLCFFMVSGGFALLMSLFLSEGTLTLTIFAMVGKMCITASYCIIYVFTAESFPTVVRNIAVGSSSMIARVGGALAPYINLLGDFWKPLPHMIFGGLSLAAGILSLFLEETNDCPMSDLIEEKKTSFL